MTRLLLQMWIMKCLFSLINLISILEINVPNTGEPEIHCLNEPLLIARNSQGQQQATKGQKGAYTSWFHFLMNLPLEM